MAIAEYKLVRATNAAALTSEVTAAIADEWQPFGGPLRDENGGMLLQAMVKETAPETP